MDNFFAPLTVLFTLMFAVGCTSTQLISSQQLTVIAKQEVEPIVVTDAMPTLKNTTLINLAGNWYGLGNCGGRQCKIAFELTQSSTDNRITGTYNLVDAFSRRVNYAVKGNLNDRTLILKLEGRPGELIIEVSPDSKTITGIGSSETTPTGYSFRFTATKS